MTFNGVNCVPLTCDSAIVELPCLSAVERGRFALSIAKTSEIVWGLLKF